MALKPSKISSVIKTEELRKLRRDKTSLILDLRSSDSYNGWIFSGEKRGGHIKGSYNWPDEETIPEAASGSYWNNIVLYGSDEQLISRTARRLSTLSDASVYRYYDFIDKWTPDHSCPMEKLFRHDHLLPTEVLSRMISGKKDFHLLHCHSGESHSFRLQHLPGAAELDTLWLESPEIWNRRSFYELRKTAVKLGLKKNDQIVLYGGKTEIAGSGQIGAFRCAHILMYMGLENVMILNGGMEKWIREGRPLSSHPEHSIAEDSIQEPGTDLGCEPLRPDFFIDQDQIENTLHRNDRTILSVRSRSEFEGQTSGYPFIIPKGHIPGAVFSDSGPHAQSMEKYRNSNQTMLDYKVIRDRWMKLGIKGRQGTIFSCGTGWRASEAWYYAWLQGLENISVYDGGWYEWSKNHCEQCSEPSIP